MLGFRYEADDVSVLLRCGTAALDIIPLRCFETSGINSQYRRMTPQMLMTSTNYSREAKKLLSAFDHVYKELHSMLNAFNSLDKYCFSFTPICFDSFLPFLSKYLLSVKVQHIPNSEHKEPQRFITTFSHNTLQCSLFCSQVRDRLLPISNVLLCKIINLLKNLGVPNLLYSLLNFLWNHKKKIRMHDFTTHSQTNAPTSIRLVTRHDRLI